MKNIIKLIRVKHWIKNGLICFPLIFGGKLGDFVALQSVLVGVITFCLLSSMIYIVNDIKDIESDRAHPIKCSRPLASGAMTIVFAKGVWLFLLIGVIAGELFLGRLNPKLGYSSWFFCLTYFALNLGYSLGWKHVPILDILILASGFLLRVIYGGIIINVEISKWLYLTVITFAFYLGLGKRRNEIQKIDNLQTRKVLKFYNERFLDRSMQMFLTLGLVFYSLWTAENSVNQLVWTVPLAFVIVLKYSLTLETESFGDPTDILMSDRLLFLLIGLWLIMVCTLLYAL